MEAAKDAGLPWKGVIDLSPSPDLVGLVRKSQELASETGAPALVSANAYERQGVNAIPAALAKLLSERLAAPFRTTVVQTNIVSHTGADGYGRLARQACFDGDVDKDVMVDDFIGQGGTLANLRGWIEKRGGKVVGAVALTGEPYSARLNPSREQLRELRERHGQDLEEWWREHFGHTFDCLTQSEARYLARSPAPRMLTRSEIDLLRQGVREIAQVTHEVLASRSGTSQS